MVQHQGSLDMLLHNQNHCKFDHNYHSIWFHHNRLIDSFRNQNMMVDLQVQHNHKHSLYKPDYNHQFQDKFANIRNRSIDNLM
jgi:hypothetical protein